MFIPVRSDGGKYCCKETRKLLVNAVTGEVESQYVKCPVTRLTGTKGVISARKSFLAAWE